MTISIGLNELKDLKVTHGCIEFGRKTKRVESILIWFKFKELTIPISIKRNLALKLKEGIIKQFKND